VNRVSAKPVLLKAAALLAFALAGPAGAAQVRPDAGLARVAVDRDFLVGSWSDSGSGDCSATVAFGGDGTFATAEGDEGVWNLSGDSLTLTGAAGSRTVTIIPIDRDTMEVVGENGAHDRSTRCAGDLGNVHFDTQRIA
jgi:hypothetical protein